MGEPDPDDRSADSSDDHRVSSVTELLDRMDAAAQSHERTSIGDTLDAIGHRSFGPLLLLAGLVMVAPVVGDIPGVPVLMGLMVMLIAGQFLVGRDHIWLPEWLLRRSVSNGKVRKGIGWMRPVGRFFDRWSKPRLKAMTHGAGFFVIGTASIIIAAATPVMEVVPFSANFAGLAISAYGLALIADDGLVAILAIAFSAGTLALIIRNLL